MSQVKSEEVSSWMIDIESFNAKTHDESIILLCIIDLIISIFKDNFSIAHLESVPVVISSRPNTSQNPSPYTQPLYSPHGFVAYVDYESTYYCQLMYQLAHELCHVVTRCFPKHDEYKWISETMSGAASFYLMFKTSKRWKHHPLLSKKLGYYSDAVSEYFDNMVATSKSNIPIRSFFKNHEDDLKRDPYGDVGHRRPRNDVIALFLYGQIRRYPKGWSSIKHFEKCQCGHSGELSIFFDSWLEACNTPEEQRFVESYKTIIGV